MKVCPHCGLKYPDQETRCFVDGAQLETAADPYLGSTLAGRYLVEREIGVGGMATVYQARHTLVDRPVAVKIMGGKFAQDPSLRERFRREAKNSAALAHHNVVEIYDYGETDNGALFLVMELLHGAPLSQVIEAGALAPPMVAVLALQIAEGLARAHDFGVVHRDLKPENIFVCDAGAGRVQVKLLDFGLARSMHDERLTNQGEIFGTAQYMAPERITSIDTGPPADLYALGVILFELITGKLPFEAENLAGFFVHHLQTPPPRPSELAPQCPRRLEELILRLLSKKPEDRPVDAHAVIKELRLLVPRDGVPLSPPPVTTSAPIQAPTLPPTSLERWARRALIFEEMLATAFPQGAPDAFVRMLAEFKTTFRRLGEARSAGLKQQRTFEAHEADTRDNRARLGHAVQSLGEDLSSAREGLRQAKAEVAPYFDAEVQAKLACEALHRQLTHEEAFTTLSAPSEPLARLLRENADAVERWLLAQSAGAKARDWVLGREKEVADLEFQVQALRSLLERAEGEFETLRAQTEQALRETESRTQAEEKQLIALARTFCDGLRDNRSLRPLFQRLEQESG